MTDGLPRRALLGVELPSVGDVFTDVGVRVAGTIDGSMARAAGVESGDVLVKLGDATLRSPDELRVALRRAGGEESVAIVVERAGARIERVARVQHLPRETLADGDVVYDHVVSDGARLRTIVTRPHGVARAPAVLFVQGLSSESIDFGARPDAPVCRLVHGWTRERFVTVRIEKRGIGDSEGEGSDVTDFDAEVADVRAALRALASYDFVDRDAVFVFGHSIGGMIAPLVAPDAVARGLVVYGTSAARWFECLDASTRRQLRLRSASADAIDEGARREREELRTRAIVDGRPASFHRQLDAADIAAAWSRVDRPVLVLCGEHDWVVSEDEQRAIVDIVNAAHPGAAHFAMVPCLDHLMTRHASVAESLRAYGSGAFDEAIVGESSGWMRRVMGV
jgi:alpha-beta hydrolase superfamily lysophospholipase